MRRLAFRFCHSSAVVCFSWIALPSPALGQSTLWEIYLKDGKEASDHGQNARAKKLFILALEEAEKFQPGDLRLVLSLNSLAGLYRTEGDYAKAEPLY